MMTLAGRSPGRCGVFTNSGPISVQKSVVGNGQAVSGTRQRLPVFPRALPAPSPPLIRWYPPSQHPRHHLIRGAVTVVEGLDVHNHLFAHFHPAFDGG